MIGPVFAFATIAALVGCSPEPRSAAYFAAHRTEASRLIAECRAGTHRGEECVNAQTGAAAAARDARLDAYRKAF